jgi:predicted nucleic acid-binding protein
LSVITIGELYKGIERLPKSRRKDELYEWFTDELLVRYEGRILPMDTETLMAWGTLIARLESKGQVMPAMDSLIAATVLANQMVLVTRNVSDFEFADIEIINPWK